MIDTVLQAIAEPRRRAILRLIHGVEQSSGEIASHFNVSRPAISQHLQVLAEAGLVTVRPVGTRRLYMTRPEGLAELRQYLDDFWGDRLLLLKQAAELEERRSSRVQVQTKGGVVEREVHIAAQPETIFPFLIDQDKIVQWQGVSATLDPRPGGVYHSHISKQHVIHGAFVLVEPPHRVVFTFGWEGEGQPIPPGGSTVEITLIAEGTGTILRVRHSDIPAEAQGGHAEGWDHYLERLIAVGEGRDPGSDPWAAE